MKSKKSKSADISRERANLLLIGGVIATAFTLMAFEWNTFSGSIEIETIDDETAFVIPFDEPIFNIKKPIPVKPKTIIPPRRDEVAEKKTVEIEKKVTIVEMDTTLVVDVNIDDDEGDDIIVIDTITDNTPADLGDLNVKIPYYDFCKDATYDEKLNCISGKIHETLMEGLEDVTSEQIERNKSDKMYVLFVISKEGKITDVIIPHESNFQKGIVQKVKATMTDVPVMNPATRFGKNVAINFSIPIRFSAN